MPSYEERPRLNPAFPVSRLITVKARLLEGARDIAGHMPGGFSQRGGKRPVSDYRADTRNNDGNGGRHVCGKLAQTRRRPRVVDLGTRRRSDRLRNHAFIIVTPRND
jgi:hypothetical protein